MESFSFVILKVQKIYSFCFPISDMLVTTRLCIYNQQLSVSLWANIVYHLNRIYSFFHHGKFSIYIISNSTIFQLTTLKTNVFPSLIINSTMIFQSKNIGNKHDFNLNVKVIIKYFFLFVLFDFFIFLCLTFTTKLVIQTSICGNLKQCI